MFRLKEAKESWQLNAKPAPRLDPVLQRKYTVIVSKGKIEIWKVY